MQEIRLVLDFSQVESQLLMLSELPNHVINNLLGLGFEIVLGEFTSAVSVDGPIEVTCPVRLDGCFEGFAATLRTPEGDISHTLIV